MTPSAAAHRHPRPVPAARPDGVRDPRAVDSSTCWSRTTPCTWACALVMQGINSWPLLAVPLFILVGIVATRSEIADRLYDAALLLLGPLRAGLAYVNIAVSLGFSWMSGAALADAAGIGAIEVGHMRKKGYPAEFSVGLSASSALISPIMPPSIPAVVYASVAAVSTGALFAAAVIPALLMTAALVVTVFLWSRRRPDLVGEPYNWAATRRALLRAIPPMGAPDHHPGRHPRRILHAHRGRRHRRALHAAAGAVVPDDADARRRADLPRHGRHQRPDHDHHRRVRAAQLDPGARAGAADRGARRCWA